MHFQIWSNSIKSFSLFPSHLQVQRSFSTAKRVKNYLRSTMSDARLTHLCILSIERGLSGEMLADPSSVIDRFANYGRRRLSLT